MASDPLNPRMKTPAELMRDSLGGLGDGFGRVVAIFDEVAGPELARHATAASLRRGTLTVRCSSASWAQTINMSELDLVDRLAQHLGPDKVTRIVARAGAPSTATTRRDESPAAPPLPPLPADQERRLEQLVARIDDPSLRARVLAAARASERRRADRQNSAS